MVDVFNTFMGASRNMEGVKAEFNVGFGVVSVKIRTPAGRATEVDRADKTRRRGLSPFYDPSRTRQDITPAKLLAEEDDVPRKLEMVGTLMDYLGLVRKDLQIPNGTAIPGIQRYYVFPEYDKKR